MKKNLEKALKNEGVKKKMPAWISPMLATLTEEYFSDKNWIFEKKFDGIRCLGFKSKSKIELYSRNHKSQNHIFPELIEPFNKAFPGNVIIDGEIVSASQSGGFSSLQPRLNVKDVGRIKGKKVSVVFYVFDILYFDGYLLTHFPLLERKKLLKKILKPSGKIKYAIFRKTHGERYLKEAAKKGWEGLIAKKADSIYVSKRSRDWLKFKCDVGQEFVICGYTEPQGSRIGFGALLIGYYDRGKLRFAGKVGTGFDEAMLSTLGKKLKNIEVKKCPLEGEKPRIKGVHWVRPKYVGEVKFTEWTKDGKLRHPRFTGLRRDKSAKKVVRE